MFHPLSEVRLKGGAAVECGIVQPPAEAWADRVEEMLQHKGDPWNWQNSEVLRREVGLGVRFFVLHRARAPFANIMLVESAGVGIIGHVWTDPADRGVGASSLLLERLLDDFAGRGGQALFLGTDFDSAPWHYYRRRGFEPVEEGSGCMARYFRPQSAWEQAWFDPMEATVQPLTWRHWPAAAPLFLGDFPGTVRLAATRLFGRGLPEGPLLPLLRTQAAGGRTASVLCAQGRSAVLGLASIQLHPLWPDTAILDLFCHPRAWPRAGELLAALEPLPAGRVVSYADATLAPKREALLAARFRELARLPRWVSADARKKTWVDVTLYARN